MNKRLGAKPKSVDETLINWSVLSILLTNKKENVRQNRVPSKHKESIDELIYYIKCWREGKKLISPEAFKDKIKNLDLISIIMDEK
jgi:hypothetical protein